MQYELLFRIQPYPKGRPRATRTGQIYTPEKTREAEKELKLLMRSYWKWGPLTAPLYVECTFTYAYPKSMTKKKRQSAIPLRDDTDNLFKLVADSGNEIIWQDDKQIVELRARKCYGETSSVRLIVEPR